MARADALWRDPSPAPTPMPTRTAAPSPDPESEEERRRVAALSVTERRRLEAEAKARTDSETRDRLDAERRAAAQAEAARRNSVVERMAAEQLAWSRERDRLGEVAHEASIAVQGCRATIGAARAAGDQEAAVEAALRLPALERIAALADEELQAQLLRQPSFSGPLR